MIYIWSKVTLTYPTGDYFFLPNIEPINEGFLRGAASGIELSGTADGPGVFGSAADSASDLGNSGTSFASQVPGMSAIGINHVAESITPCPIQRTYAASSEICVESTDGSDGSDLCRKT
jgi:hypothetical protein